MICFRYFSCIALGVWSGPHRVLLAAFEVVIFSCLDWEESGGQFSCNLPFFEDVIIVHGSDGKTLLSWIKSRLPVSGSARNRIAVVSETKLPLGGTIPSIYARLGLFANIGLT